MPFTRRQILHWAWVILIASFFTLFVNYGIRIGGYSVLLPKMIQDLHLSMTQVGVIRAAFFLTYVLFSPLMGWLTDRFGGRLVISFFCLFLASGTFLLGKAWSYPAAVLFHAIAGIGSAALWTPTVTLVQKWFAAPRRGFALGMLAPCGALGSALTGLILPVIVKNYSWRLGWSCLGISGLLLVFINGFLLRNDPEDKGLLPWGETSRPTEYFQASSPQAGYGSVFSTRQFWMISLSYLLISLAAYIVTDFIVTYGVKELRIPHPVASSFISILSFTWIPGAFCLMTASDYIGRKRSLLIIHLMVAITILSVIATGNHLSLLQVEVGVFGFFYGPIWPMYAACARDYFPKEITGTVIGLMTVFYGVGGMLGPLLAGHLTDLTGTFHWPFGLVVLSSCAAALPILFLKGPNEGVANGEDRTGELKQRSF